MSIGAKKQRSVTLNSDTYARFEEAAQAAGLSVSAWLARAGEEVRRRESARAYAEYLRDPQVQEEVAAWHRFAEPQRAALWERLQAEAA